MSEKKVECSRRGAETQSGERIEDIVAELREDGDAVMSECHDDDCWSNFEAGQIYYELADRIEEAHKREMSKIVSKNGADFGQLGDAAAKERIATPAEGMPPKRDAHRGAHPETAKSCLGMGEMEKRQTMQIGEISGGGRAEAKSRTATAGADPEPAKSLVNVAAMRERDEMLDALVRIGNWCAQDLAENTYISDSSGNYLKTLNGLCEVCKPYMQKASKLKRYGGVE